VETVGRARGDGAMLLRLSAEDRARLVRLAVAEDRTMTSVIRQLIRQADAALTRRTRKESGVEKSP
jgi:hypothetical protein